MIFETFRGALHSLTTFTTMANKPSSSSLQSGLRTVKRDWTANISTATEPVIYELDDDEWPPSPEKPKPKAPRRELSQYEKDLTAGQQKASAQVLVTANFVNQKRPIADSKNDDMRPAKKRVLPSSFSDLTPKSSRMSATLSSSTNFTFSKTRTTNTESRTDKVEKSTKVELSPEQKQILQVVEEGHSVFYTGSAGTGKSVLLREVIKSLRKSYGKSTDAIAITASTGIAACNIGGVTLHSFSGIGLGTETAEQLATKVKKNRKATTRWQRTQVLIIDEVSMVDGDLFDKLARIGSIIRKKVDPFGGIQIIATGDFFQLPPVMKGSQPKFAFEAQLWKATMKRTFNLNTVFRQRDPEFVNMLNEMRFGRLSSQSINTFKSLSREINCEDGIMPTELFPLREQVDRSNATRMSMLKEKEEHEYRATDGGSITDPQIRGKMLANFMAPERLHLKVDSQVMLIKNMDDQLVNGSIGRVLRFQDVNAKDESGSGEGESKKPARVTVGQKWPVVAFTVPGDIKTVREVSITPDVFKVEQPDGEVQVSRTQLPLILAWAMSIHKSQGQTLERVKVDLGKVFEKGQAYVALSRATSLQGLQILNFNPSKVMAHPKVIEWSKTLEVLS